MAKYPSLDGRQRKAYMSKVELPETQVLTATRLAVTHGFLSTWTKLNLYFSPQLFGPQSVTSVV